MRAIIFANGELRQPEAVLSLLKSGDLLIAADGGGFYMSKIGLQPEVAMGDFDSLSEEQVNLLESRGVKILRYPEKKDFTDLELALQYAKSVGAEEVILFGALGNRWDQTLANLLLPGAAEFSTMRISLVDGSQEIRLIQAGQTLQLTGQPGDTLSLIPLAGNAIGITTKGLEYPLQNETLKFGSTRGVSNVLLADCVSVSIEGGKLLCVLIHADQTA